jgi:ATP-dependent DNA ligase
MVNTSAVTSRTAITINIFGRNVEVKYLAWTGDNLLRQVVCEGLREDKPAADVRREVPS